MLLTTLCAEFLADRRARNRSPNTLARYETALRMWRRWRATHDLVDTVDSVTAAEVRRYLDYLRLERRPHEGSTVRPVASQRGLSPAAISGEVRPMRAMWRWAAGEGYLTAEQKEIFAPGRMPIPPSDASETDRPYWDAETEATLLQACTGRPEQRLRDQAIIRLLYASGLRLDELCRLDEAMIGDDGRSARIVGKGRKKRFVFWGDEVTAALDAYRLVRRGPHDGPLFRGTTVKNDGGRMTCDSVRARMKKIFRRAGLTVPSQPVHSARHGFAHAMIDGGAEISQVSQLMGHADVKTTMRYLRERPERLQAIYDQVQARRRAHPERARPS